MPTPFHRFMRNLPWNGAEWVTSAIIAGLGTLMLFFPESLTRPDLSNFLDIMTTQQWTALCLFIGTIRIVALGTYAEIPRASAPVRWVGAMVGALIFAVFLGRALDMSTIQSVSFGVVLYGVPMIADMLSVKHALVDSIRVWRTPKSGLVRATIR